MDKNKISSFLIVIVLGIILGCWYFTNYYYEDLDNAVKTAFDSIVAQDQDTTGKYLDCEQLYGTGDDAGIYELILRDFSYELISTSQNETVVQAELSVSNRDIESIYGQFVVEAYQLVISEAYRAADERLDKLQLKEEIDHILIDKLKTMETEERTQTTVVNLTRKGRSWHIDLNEDNLDAIYGGYVTAQKAADNVLGDRSTEALSKLEEAYQQKIDNTNHVLRNAAHYMVDSLWNGELVDIVSCINAGTDASGNEYDLNAGIENMQAILADKHDYDVYIAELDDTYYSEVKMGWQRLSEACDTLAESIESADPEPLDFDYIPDTTEFEEARNQFVELVYPQK